MMEREQQMPGEVQLSIYMQSAFDTEIIIDASSYSIEQYRDYAARTLSLLEQWYPDAKWSEEDAGAIHGSGDAIDFLPVLNLSFVMAICPKLLAKDSIAIKVPGGAVCTVRFLTPTVYFQSFSAGIISMQALLDWNQPYTIDDLRIVNDQLLTELGSLIEAKLSELISVYIKAVHQSKVPQYALPFSGMMPAALNRNLLYWSHFAYVARASNVAELSAAAECLKPLMMPLDQQGIYNMALKADRFIYLGWGRSIICCLATLDEKVIRTYTRLIEIRNYLWKTLYDLDRGLRKAVLVTRNLKSEREANRLTDSLRALDFRVKGILEELDSFKITFDHEKIWLVKQLDINWLMSDLIASVQSRLESFCDFYDYSQATTRRIQEQRLQWVLNLLAIIATAGALVAVIAFFDPTNHLLPMQRAEIFLGGMAAVALVLFVAVATSRKRED